MFSPSAVLTVNDAKVFVADAIKPDRLTNYAASIYVQGTFNGGTVNLYMSIDQGATFSELKDASGNVIASTGNDIFFINLGGGKGSKADLSAREQIWAAVTGGGGGQNVNVTVNSNG